MKPDKYEVLRLADALEPQDRQWLKAMMSVSETIEIKKVIRTSLEKQMNEIGTVAAPRYEGAIDEEDTVMHNVMFAIASLSRSPDDLFLSAKINKVIEARLGRYVNVANGAYEAIGLGYMKSKPISPRRHTYGLTEVGWQYVQAYMAGSISYLEEVAGELKSINN